MKSPRLGAIALLSLVSASAISAACVAPTAEERTGKSSQALLRDAGLDTTNTWSVGVCAGDLTSGLCTNASRCSASLVAPNLVLTARHCTGANTDYAKPVFCENTFTTPALTADKLHVTLDSSVAEGTPQWREVESILVPSTDGFCADDMALLVLKDNVPATAATPVAVNVNQDLVTWNPTKVAMVGRGRIFEIIVSPDGGPTTADNGGLQRRLLQNVDVKCLKNDAIACTVEDATSPPSNSWDVPGYYVSIDGVTGSGDSGGGFVEQQSYSQNKPVVVGVMTLATASLATGQANFTHGLRTDRQKTFLVDGAKSASTKGGYPLPVWAGGAPPDAGTDGGSTEEDAGTTPPKDAGTTNDAGGSSSGGTGTDDGSCAFAPAQRSGPVTAGAFGLVALGAVLARRAAKKRRA